MSEKPSSQQEEKPRFAFKPLSELVRHHPGLRSWWIRGYIPAASVILFYGDPACGKTTLVTDVAGHIATSMAWCGIPAKKGRVLYIAAEDFYGARLRLESWFEHRGLPVENIDVLDCPVVIADESDVDAIIAYIKTLPEPPAVLVVDTLALSMGSFSENNDMQLFCNGATKIKRETEVTVAVIHHCGHADKGRSRGGSQLPANADAIFAVERREDICFLSCQKMKNGPEPKPLSWRMDGVSTKWLDEDGQPITSVVLTPVSVPPQTASRPVLGGNQQTALEVLKTLYAVQSANLAASGIDGQPKVAIRDWFRELRNAGLPKSRCSEVKSALLERGVIEIAGDCYVRAV